MSDQSNRQKENIPYGESARKPSRHRKRRRNRRLLLVIGLLLALAAAGPLFSFRRGHNEFERRQPRFDHDHDYNYLRSFAGLRVRCDDGLAGTGDDRPHVRRPPGHDHQARARHGE